MPSLAIVKPQPGDEITSTWGTSVADGMNGIQSGTGTMTWSGAAGPSNPFAVTFPRPYATPPIVVVSLGPSSASVNFIMGTNTAPTATGFTAQARHYQNSTQAAGTQTPFSWVAIGTPA